MVLWNLHTYLPMVEWPAHDHGNGSHHQILAAYFLTPNRLLTHGRNDGLAVWDTWGYASAAIDAPLTVPDRCAAATAPPPRLLGRMEIVNGGFCAASVVPGTAVSF
ncbi:hypothetical protein BC828DRAFT_197161 [Blastocladiella britannica]|nr:hypothetical protein BC828DRAFT_197161 [Blastocladiella britannica]